MSDSTETARRTLLAAMQARGPLSREALEAEHGRVWNPQELLDTFEVRWFAAPLVVVRRKADGVQGSLMFQHEPRFYFEFEPT